MLDRSIRFLISDSFHPPRDNNDLNFISSNCLPYTILEVLVADKSELDEELLKFTDACTPKFLASACLVLDSFGMMTERVDRQIRGAQGVLRFQRTNAMCKRRAAPFFSKIQLTLGGFRISNIFNSVICRLGNGMYHEIGTFVTFQSSSVDL